jgi:hypothetical protein
MNLTQKEKQALKNYWGMSLRIKNGNVELKKGECWGILCSIENAKENAQLLIARNVN